MRIQGIIHQQISQLKWHILACVWLVMALPIENTIISIIKKEDISVGGIIFLSIFFIPLLAGLIACADVQADLDEKRYIFWRSKPVNVKYLMTIKYFVGLFITFFILACPVIFGIIAINFSNESLKSSGLAVSFLLFLLLSTMTYSLCFMANVFIRNTARSWLVGMLITGFLFVFPFLLPFNYRDYYRLFDSRSFFIIIMPSAAIVAFILSLLAAQHDWHLKTNLKNLLWVIAGLLFVLTLLFSSQVANIKVLEEKDVTSLAMEQYPFNYVGNKIMFQKQFFINTDDNKISFSDIGGGVKNFEPYENMMIDGYNINRIYPWNEAIIKQVGDNIYSFAAYGYGNNVNGKQIYEKLYLRCQTLIDRTWTQISEIDLSAFLNNSDSPLVSMKLLDNNLYVFIRKKSLVVVDTTNPDDLKITDTWDNNLPLASVYLGYREKQSTIPLLPINNLDIEDRIKLSIDWNYNYENFYGDSIVDEVNGKISFFLDDYSGGLLCYDVVRWDKKNIYCQKRTSRPLTVLEEVVGQQSWRRLIYIKNGRLYWWGSHTLIVFDIRTNQKITKLGHFVRMDYNIDDLAVSDDGNILLYMSLLTKVNGERNYLQKKYLCLLEAPK